MTRHDDLAEIVQETPPVRGLAYDRFAMERVILFSDAVYAIIMTLLALDVRLPENAVGVPLATQLVDTLPKLGSYALSFLVVSTLWRIHLKRFRYLVAIDGALVGGNIAQLLLTGLLPFSTSVLNSHLGGLAVILYAGNIVAISIVSWLTWRHARRQPELVSPELTDDMRRDDDRRTAVTVVVFGASMLVARWDPVLATASWLMLWPANHLLNRFEHRASRPKPSP